MQIYKVGDMDIVFFEDKSGDKCVKCLKGRDIEHISWRVGEINILLEICKEYEKLKGGK